MPKDAITRPDPDELLRQVEEQQRHETRGRLKVFLGYAPGVGKSFQMIDEARRRKERGEDVVIIATQPSYPADVQNILARLPQIPPFLIGGGQAIDVPAILRRRPGVVVVDGLAYDNPPGCLNAKRWQDVEQILAAGISVITTINLQYIEELQDITQEITGKRAAQSGVPRTFLETAEEIVLVDAPALEERLSKLRELALLVAAEVVDRQLENYLRLHGIDRTFGIEERILVCITPRSNAARMIASGRRNADRFHGELHVIYVGQKNLSPEDEIALARKKAIAQQHQAKMEMLDVQDPVTAIIHYAHTKGITQIFIGHSLKRNAWSSLWGGAIDRLIRLAEGIDVIIFPH